MVSEAVKGITGLRRDPGAAVRAAQIAGTKLPDPATWDQRVTTRLQYIPEWGDYTLSQLTADGFTVKKRTKKGYGWIAVDQGRRASGLGYVGGVSGGFAFGLRDFWQRHPTQLDIRGAATEEAEVTVWLWSPEAGPMDTALLPRRHGPGHLPGAARGPQHHLRGLRAGLRHAVRHRPDQSSCTFWALAATPTAARLGDMADQVRTPPQLRQPGGPDRQHAGLRWAGHAGRTGRSPAKKSIEDHLDFLFDLLPGPGRAAPLVRVLGLRRHHAHLRRGPALVWRYDVGGYAWDNSELSPDLWLWYAFLRSGRADIFRFAEAMTRHTGEVDVYHLGQWAGLGTRHGVQHWADSAKQQRISTAIYRRFYYYLTADERTGDLMSRAGRLRPDVPGAGPAAEDQDRAVHAGPARAVDRPRHGLEWSGRRLADRVGAAGPEGATCARPSCSARWRRSARCRTASSPGSGLYDLDTGRFARSTEKTGQRVAPQRDVRPGGDLRRADRPGRPAGVRGGVAAVLPPLQRHPGRADGASAVRTSATSSSARATRGSTRTPPSA